VISVGLTAFHWIVLNENSPESAIPGCISSGVEMGGIEPPSEKQDLQLATLIVGLLHFARELPDRQDVIADYSGDVFRPPPLTLGVPSPSFATSHPSADEQASGGRGGQLSRQCVIVVGS
jgi:hypothetical protein